MVWFALSASKLWFKRVLKVKEKIKASIQYAVQCVGEMGGKKKSANQKISTNIFWCARKIIKLNYIHYTNILKNYIVQNKKKIKKLNFE